MQPTGKVPRYLSRTALADHLCLDVPTVEKWVEEGILPRPSLRHGKEAWRWSDVEKALSDDAGEYCRVYFVESQGFIKIGFTADLPSRLSQLASGLPSPINLLCHIPGDFDLETDLHRRFGHLRERGEWFRRDPELLAFIEEQTKNYGQSSQVG